MSSFCGRFFPAGICFSVSEINVLEINRRLTLFVLWMVGVRPHCDHRGLDLSPSVGETSPARATASYGDTIGELPPLTKHLNADSTLDHPIARRRNTALNRARSTLGGWTVYRLEGRSKVF